MIDNDEIVVLAFGQGRIDSEKAKAQLQERARLLKIVDEWRANGYLVVSDEAREKLASLMATDY